MYLTYVDEIKNDGSQEPYYWLCGLAISEDDIERVEGSLNGIAKAYFVTSLLDVTSEFHATQIIQGKGPFKGRDITGRLDLIKQLASVISRHPDIGRIRIRLNPARMPAGDCQKVAFMFLVERVEQLMCARKSRALLIVDHDAQFVGANVRNLSSYKACGTDFEYGQSITHIVDTVHHIHSHHSRLLQLADIYAYSMSICQQENLKHVRRGYAEYARKLSNFSFPTKWKNWPA
jgi:hypothetical protein